MIKESREFKTPGIYAISNKANCKIYIGSSQNIHSRICEHVLDLDKNIHKNSYLQNSWNKYGKNSFELMVVETCDFDILLDREQHWIDHFVSYDRNKGYNLHKDAQRHYVCDETREKLSKRFAGKRNPRYGVKGCTRNDEQLKRHSESCSKPVSKCDLEGAEISFYKSIKDAAKQNGLYSSNIVNCLKGKNKTCGGYKWEYRKEDVETHEAGEISVNIDKISENQSKVIFQKIKKSKKQIERSEETKRKISESLKGNIPWNKGKKMSKEFCEKVSMSQKGRVPWNKGIKMKNRREI